LEVEVNIVESNVMGKCIICRQLVKVDVLNDVSMPPGTTIPVICAECRGEEEAAPYQPRRKT
jgi:hypothetical protein